MGIRPSAFLLEQIGLFDQFRFYNFVYLFQIVGTQPGLSFPPDGQNVPISAKQALLSYSSSDTFDEFYIRCPI